MISNIDINACKVVEFVGGSQFTQNFPVLRFSLQFSKEGLHTSPDCRVRVWQIPGLISQFAPLYSDNSPSHQYVRCGRERMGGSARDDQDGQEYIPGTGYTSI